MSKALWVVPTYRSLEGAKTLRAYADHFDAFGHASQVDLLLSDDSTEKVTEVLNLLKETGSKYKGNIYYLGINQKQYIRQEVSKICSFSDQESAWLTDVTRPSYGGNRNAGLLALAILADQNSYQFVMSSDDDMKPGGYTQNSQYISNNGHVLEARFVPKNDITRYHYTTTDIFKAFEETLGHNFSEIRSRNNHYQYGFTARDSHVINTFNYATDLSIPETITHLVDQGNCTKLASGVVQIAHTFRSGHEDGDASTLLAAALSNGTSISNGHLSTNDLLIQDVRPYVVENNWMHDCGVAGYTTIFSLENPFLPTTLRCEDFGHRLKIEQDQSILGARVNAIQHHSPSTTNRPGLVQQFYIEEVSLAFKRLLTDGGFPSQKLSAHRPDVPPQIFEGMLSRSSQLIEMSRHSKSPDAEMIACQLQETFMSDNTGLYRRVYADLDTAWKSTVAINQIWPRVIDALQENSSQLASHIIKIR